MWLEIHHDGVIGQNDYNRDRSGRIIDFANFPNGTMLVCPFCRTASQPESSWESSYSTRGYPMLWCSNCDARAVAMMHEIEPTPFGSRIGLGQIDRVVNYQLEYKCPEIVPDENIIRFLHAWAAAGQEGPTIILSEFEQLLQSMSDNNEDDEDDEDDEDEDEDENEEKLGRRARARLQLGRKYLHPECQLLRWAELGPYMSESNQKQFPAQFFYSGITVNGYNIFDNAVLAKYEHFDPRHDGIHIMVCGHDRAGRRFTMQFNGD